VSQSQLKETLAKRKDAQITLSEAKQASVVGLSDLEDRFADAEKSFLKLTTSVEDGNAEWARAKQVDVMKMFNEVASVGIQKASLDEVDRLVQQSIHEGAEKLVPKTLNQTQKKLAAIRLWMSERENSKAKEELNRHKKTALFHARRLLQMTRVAKDFSEKAPEEIALWVEGRVYSLETSMVEDLRDRSFDEQFTFVQKNLDKSRGLASTPAKITSKK
jgi:hypothetical protein